MEQMRSIVLSDRMHMTKIWIRDCLRVRLAASLRHLSPSRGEKELSRRRTIIPPVNDDERFLRAFGNRLRGERARRGMSRKLLADHAGISERYVTQIESGKGNVSMLILRQIASALRLPLARR